MEKFEEFFSALYWLRELLRENEWEQWMIGWLDDWMIGWLDEIMYLSAIWWPAVTEDFGSTVMWKSTRE